MANVITTVLNLDATKLRTGLRGAQASIKETDGLINKAKVGWTTAFASFASSPVAIAGATAAVGTFAAASVQAASDLDESINAVNVTFGESADKILEFGESAARSVGLAQSEFNQLSTPLGSILKNAGFGLDEVADKTITLTQRAADMASVFNTDVSDALGAIQAGLRGEQDPLEKFGVGLSAAKVEARALADTGKDSAKSLTDQEKQLARVELILDQTNQTAGDFANTQDSLANQTRVLSAEFKDLQAKVGGELIPILSDLAGVMLDITEGAADAKAAIEELPGGKSLLDALGTNLFELPGKSKKEWDDLGRKIGVIPDEVDKVSDSFGKFDRAADAVSTAATAMDGAAGAAARAAEATGDAADEVVDLGDKAANSGPKIGDMAGALEEVNDRLKEAAEEGAQQFQDALQGVLDKVDEVAQGVRDRINLEGALDDITAQFRAVQEAGEEAAENGKEGTAQYREEVRRLRLQLLDLVGDLDNLSANDKIRLSTEIERGSLDELFRIVGELSKGITVPVVFNTPQQAFSGTDFVFGNNAIPNTIFQNPNPAPVDNSRTIINYPVGSSPTTTAIDQRLYATRNGPR